ncbi:phage tail protein [Clostridium butyricum]|uniref:phage tail protein n=1 Tax=Clostridium butyricum TaxID=1492 RepID=UPI003D34EE96
MISIYDSSITDVLPTYLKSSSEVQAISYAVSNQINKIKEKIKVIQLFNSIDILSEDVLDILAVELRTRCYNEEYPRDIKIKLVKNSLNWYLYSGTPAELEELCKVLYGGATVEEWFDYEGNPYHFRIGVDVTETRLNVDIDGIKRTIERYKRASTRLAEIILQCSVNCSVYTKTDYFKFSTERTGKSKTGENPYRNTKAILSDDNISIKSCEDNYKYKSDYSGTKPYRNTIGAVISDNIENSSTREIYEYYNDNTGTIPGRNTSAVIRDNNIKADTSKDDFILSSHHAGSDQCGVNPNSNITAVLKEDNITVDTCEDSFNYSNNVAGCDNAGTKPNQNLIGEVKNSKVDITSQCESDKYTSCVAGECNAGEYPCKNTGSVLKEDDLIINTIVDCYNYQNKNTGVEPYRNTTAEVESGFLKNKSETEEFSYKVKRCGTVFCNRK